MCILSSLDSFQCELRCPTVSHQMVIPLALKTFESSRDDSVTKHFALPSESPALGQFMTFMLIVKIFYCNLERLLKRDITFTYLKTKDQKKKALRNLDKFYVHMFVILYFIKYSCLKKNWNTARFWLSLHSLLSSKILFSIYWWTDSFYFPFKCSSLHSVCNQHFRSPFRVQGTEDTDAKDRHSLYPLRTRKMHIK